MRWHHFAEVPGRRRRIEIFCETYGVDPIPDITARMAAMQRTVAAAARHLAAQGIEPQATWLADGTLDASADRADWTLSHRDLFES